MPRCQYCGQFIPNGRKLKNQHEPNCEWKAKKEEWQKRVTESQGKTFWYVDSSQFVLKPCVLSTKAYEMIRFFEEDGKVDEWSSGYREENLFGNKDQAQTRLDYLKKIYLQTFKFKPFLRESYLANNLDKLTFIESQITEKLKDFSNFNGIDFCDVSAGGIQIRGHHKEIKGYTYGSQPTIKYDFSNYLDCIDEFVNMWIQYDTPAKVRQEQHMIADCEKWGWD